MRMSESGAPARDPKCECRRGVCIILALPWSHSLFVLLRLALPRLALLLISLSTSSVGSLGGDLDGDDVARLGLGLGLGLGVRARRRAGRLDGDAELVVDLLGDGRGLPRAQGDATLEREARGAHEVRVHLLGGLATFLDTPDNERLAAAAVARGEHARNVGGVLL